MKVRSIDKISIEFAQIVRKKLKDRIKKIVLFGSHARGDFNEGSDYDILVIVDKREKQKTAKIDYEHERFEDSVSRA